MSDTLNACLDSGPCYVSLLTGEILIVVAFLFGVHLWKKG